MSKKLVGKHKFKARREGKSIMQKQQLEKYVKRLEKKNAELLEDNIVLARGDKSKGKETKE